MRAELEAAIAVGRSLGLTVDAPVVLSEGSNLLVHLRPAPVVARIPAAARILRPDIDRWLAREVAVATFLAVKGAPVVPPANEVPPGPHYHQGVWMTLWRFVQCTPGSLPTPAVVGVMLSGLHRALRSYPDGLPYLEAPLRDTERFLAQGERLTGLPTHELAPLRSAFERLVPRLQATPRSAQALHGDAHPGNVLATPAGWMWTDFEDTCRGPLAWDLACLATTARADGRAALVAYVAQSDPQTLPTDDELALFIEARELHRTVWYLVRGRTSPMFADAARARLGEWARKT